MRRFLLVTAVLAISANFLAQSSAPSDSKLTENAPCTVTGRVVTAAEGNPLKSARVLLTPNHTRSDSEMYAASTDSEGHFTLKDIPAGSYEFSAAHTGFVEQDYKAGANDTGPLFSLTSAQKVSDVLFRLVAAGVITGRVSNEDGEPMQRVEVVALRRPSEEEMEDIDESHRHKIEMETVGSGESDDRGQYRIFGLKPGEYFIRTTDSSFFPGGRIAMGDDFWVKQVLGSDYGSVYFPGVTQSSQAQVIPVKAGEEAQADLTMHRVKTVEISGRVIGGSGPAANAPIRLEPVDDNESDFDRQTTSDDKGAFRLRNIPEGSYYIVAYLREPGTVAYESRARQKIEVTGDNIDALTVTLTPGVPIRASIKADGSASLSVDRTRLFLMSVEEDRQFGGSCELKKDGTCEFKAVHDGSYAIQVAGLDEGTYIKSARSGPDDLLEKGLQVEGDSPGKIEITVAADSGKLEGSVADDDGPVAGARVRVVPDPLTPYNHVRIQRTKTDQLGHFSLIGIAPGRYVVTARPLVPSSGYKSETQSITLSESDHKTVEMKLEKSQE
jgi:5-hydroxyisourate hydrolase-like protein (transthyretin family)